MTQPGLHSGYSWWWLAWFTLFVVVETAAIISGEPGRTLTAHVRWLMLEHKWVASAVAALLGWLFFHFIVETYLK